MTDAQIVIWEKQIATARKSLRVSYFAEQREDAEATIKRLEQAIAERREWLASQ